MNEHFRKTGGESVNNRQLPLICLSRGETETAREGGRENDNMRGK